MMLSVLSISNFDYYIVGLIYHHPSLLHLANFQTIHNNILHFKSRHVALYSVQD